MKRSRVAQLVLAIGLLATASPALALAPASAREVSASAVVAAAPSANPFGDVLSVAATLAEQTAVSIEAPSPPMFEDGCLACIVVAVGIGLCCLAELAFFCLTNGEICAAAAAACIAACGES